MYVVCGGDISHQTTINPKSTPIKWLLFLFTHHLPTLVPAYLLFVSEDLPILGISSSGIITVCDFLCLFPFSHHSVCVCVAEDETQGIVHIGVLPLSYIPNPIEHSRPPSLLNQRFVSLLCCMDRHHLFVTVILMGVWVVSKHQFLWAVCQTGPLAPSLVPWPS